MSVRIDADLYEEIKKKAQMQGVGVREIVEDALRRDLERSKDVAKQLKEAREELDKVLKDAEKEIWEVLGVKEVEDGKGEKRGIGKDEKGIPGWLIAAIVLGLVFARRR